MPGAPAVGLFGGVHGVERIGTDILLAFLHTLNERLHWEAELRTLLEHVRVVVVPIVNPGGMLRGSRSNPHGVDLMRNAPVTSGESTFLVGGHRISRLLPWYRGRGDAPMEPEARFVTDVVTGRLLGGPLSIALDCHSGYGHKDRLWFLHANSRAPFEHLPEVYALKSLFENTYPNHDYYTIEPQSKNYMARGDLWDYLFERAQTSGRGLFIPLTLELGSMLWVRKNWRQALTYEGYFNPVKPWRRRRVLRRHLLLLEFLVAAARNYKQWVTAYSDIANVHDAALREWYGSTPSPTPSRAPTWILLRGLGRESRHWGRLPELLQARFPDARIHAIDLPGTGKLHDSESPSSVGGIVEALRERLRTLGIEPPFNVVAISLGAMAALEWMSVAPEEIARAVAINPSAANLNPFYQRLRPRHYPTILWHLLFTWSLSAREQAVLKMTTECLERTEQKHIVRQWAEYARERPLTRRNLLRQMTAARRYRLRGQAPAIPLLVLGSAKDRLVSPDCPVRIARHWNAPLRMHPRAGHDLPLDDPEWMVDSIEEWLHEAGETAPVAAAHSEG